MYKNIKKWQILCIFDKILKNHKNSMKMGKIAIKLHKNSINLCI